MWGPAEVRQKENEEIFIECIMLRDQTNLIAVFLLTQL
jgi:hypothetical protein